MACTSIVTSSAAIYPATAIRRSRSKPQSLTRCPRIVPRSPAAAAVAATNSTKFFNLSVPISLKNSSDEGLMDHEGDQDEESEGEVKRRSNWLDRILELRSRFRDRKNEENRDERDYCCGVEYDDDDEEGGEMVEKWDPKRFGEFLKKVAWSETRQFAKLAFLGNMAYVISEIKTEDLRKHYGLRLVTSSLVKKSEAAIKAEIETDSTRPPASRRAVSDPNPNPSPAPATRPIRSSAAYEVAASAASFVHSRARGLLSLGSRPSGAHGGDGDADPSGTRGGAVKPEVAALVAASTMTSVVAAEEDARLEAARDLRSLHSSPCEWFVCDDPDTCTRFFVIQGSDSLASWQANLFFEPTKFEGTEVLVHRGIYEAAKGIYEQFTPEILSHLSIYGSQARLRFTGHSLGGSLSLLVNLMLLSRGEVPASCLLPVVTFGSPSVFCSGHRLLDELGVDRDHICSVVMHRDIVPRAFSCSYPNHVAQLLKRLNGAFRSHPCLNSEKLLYSPVGELFILQPDENSSPSHPFLPPGAGLYSLRTKDANGVPIPGATSALKAFLNNPHPLETLSKPTAYGSDGTILRDHDSSNYLKAINGLIREHTKSFVRKSRRQRLNALWPRLSNAKGLVPKELVTGV